MSHDNMYYLHLREAQKIIDREFDGFRQQGIAINRIARQVHIFSHISGIEEGSCDVLVSDGEKFYRVDYSHFNGDNFEATECDQLGYILPDAKRLTFAEACVELEEDDYVFLGYIEAHRTKIFDKEGNLIFE